MENVCTEERVTNFLQKANKYTPRPLKAQYNFNVSDFSEATKTLREIDAFLDCKHPMTADGFAKKLKEMGIDWKKYWQQLPTTGWIGKLTVYLPYWNNKMKRKTELFEALKSARKKITSEGINSINKSFTSDAEKKFKKPWHKKSYIRSIFKSFACLILFPVCLASLIMGCKTFNTVQMEFSFYFTGKLGYYIVKRCKGAFTNRSAEQLIVQSYLRILVQNAQEIHSKSAVSSV
jgi:hypothetical protein